MTTPSPRIKIESLKKIDPVYKGQYGSTTKMDHENLSGFMEYVNRGGKVGLVSAREKATGKPVVLIATLYTEKDGIEEATPLGIFFTVDMKIEDIAAQFELYPDLNLKWAPDGPCG